MVFVRGIQWKAIECERETWKMRSAYMDALTAWDRGPIVCRFLSFFTFTKFRFRCLPLLCIAEQLMRSTFELQNLFVFAYVTQVDTYTVLSVGARYSLAIPMQTMLMMRTTTGKEYQYIYIYRLIRFRFSLLFGVYIRTVSHKHTYTSTTLCFWNTKLYIVQMIPNIFQFKKRKTQSKTRANNKSFSHQMF